MVVPSRVTPVQISHQHYWSTEWKTNSTKYDRKTNRKTNRYNRGRHRQTG